MGLTQRHSGLEQFLAADAVDDLETVETPRHRCGNSRFPDARRPERMQRIDPAAPAIEVTDHGDIAGIRRPDAEHGSGIRRMRPEQAVGLLIPAFVEQIKRVR